MKRRNAFTLVELLMVLSITILISVIAATSLFGVRNQSSLTNTKDEIGVLLREAQSRSISGIDGAAWGVHFDNTNPNDPFYALFSGAYSTRTRVVIYPLPPGIIFDPTTLASGATLDIIFAQISGLPSTSTAITLDRAPSGVSSLSATVRINPSGLVSY